jgi:tetratricopeptide (TPR) repeat protein
MATNPNASTGPVHDAIEVTAMPKKVITLICIPLIALSLAASVTAQVFLPPGATDTGLGGGNAITGMILVSSGQRLQRRVAVRLQTMTKGDRIAMTDDNGTFAFRGLPNGQYTIVIDKEKEYEPYQAAVDIRQFPGSPAQMYNLSIRLESKKEESAKPGILNADLANVPPRAVALYKKALEKSEAGKNAEAVEQLKYAIAEYPKFGLALTELGVQYQRLDQLDKAEESLKSALEITPDAFAPLINYGIVLVRLRRFAEAETELRLALKQKDQSAVAHYYLGRALAYSGKFDEAKKELDVSITLGGDEMKEAHRYLAGVYSALGDKQRAAAELETYLKLAPKSPDAAQLRELIRKLKG